MKRLLDSGFYISLCCLIFSCKSPVTIAFDKPIGEIKTGFGEEIQGNYYFFEDFLKPGLKQLNDSFIIEKDSIYLTGKSFPKPKVKRTVPDTGAINDPLPVDTSPLQEPGIAEFKTLAFFNNLMFLDSSSALKNFREKLTILRVNANNIQVISVDSAGNNIRFRVFVLGEKIILSSYKGKYFLNFKTDHGYEIAMVDLWNNDYLSIKPLYYSGYDEYTKDEKVLMGALNKWYPGLKPVKDPETKKIITVKGKMKPDKVMLLFDRSEQHYDFYRVNQ